MERVGTGMAAAAMQEVLARGVLAAGDPRGRGRGVGPLGVGLPEVMAAAMGMAVELMAETSVQREAREARRAERAAEAAARREREERQAAERRDACRAARSGKMARRAERAARSVRGGAAGP